jgi:hypothetical protein
MSLHDSGSFRTRTHILSLTYKPKIEAVKAGTIRQTIRLKRSDVEKRPGDKLLLHTWAGKPYRTPWDWRLETTITERIALLYQFGLWHYNENGHGQGYETARYGYMDEIAKLDGIDPPTIYGLTDTLARLNGLTSLENTFWEVIRW